VAKRLDGWVKIPFGTEVGLSSRHIVLDGDTAPTGKGVQQPPTFEIYVTAFAFVRIIRAHVHCGQTAGWIKMPFGKEVGLDPGHIVFDEGPAPPPERGRPPPKNPAHVCCGQTAGWIKMALGAAVDLGLGDMAPKKGRGTAPLTLAHVLRPNSCMDLDAT